MIQSVGETEFIHLVRNLTDLHYYFEQNSNTLIEEIYGAYEFTVVGSSESCYLIISKTLLEEVPPSLIE